MDAEATEVLRNDHSGFIVYAPPGSLKKGEALVKSGAGRTTACGVCHGEDLKGLGPVPGLAGRSPSYIGRQLYDMQAGFRKGEWTSLMKPVVAQADRRRHDRHHGLYRLNNAVSEPLALRERDRR